MKMKEFKAELNRCAADALKSALSGVSTLQLKEIRSESPSGDSGFVAYVDVLGQPHVLACEVKAEGQPMVLRQTLQQLNSSAGQLQSNVTRVLIAPYLTPQAQELCKQNHAGYLDLVGNARIELGEVFIGKRMVPNVEQTSAQHNVRHGNHNAAPVIAAA